MRAKLWLALPMIIASAALAQNAGIHGAKGEGAARSADGRIGRFLFDVEKRVRPNGEATVEGRIRFESEAANTTFDARHILIEGKALEYASRENVAEFGGRGMLVVRSRAGVTRHEGRFGCRVADNRDPRADNARPDGFRIRFNVANSDRVFEFDGAVLRGDLVVYHRG